MILRQMSIESAKISQNILKAEHGSPGRADSRSITSAKILPTVQKFSIRNIENDLNYEALNK